MAQLLLYKILQLFVMMAIGFLVAKMGILKKEDSVILARISLYLLVPPAIFNAFHIDFTRETASGLALALGAAVGIHLLFFGIDFVYRKLCHGTPADRASILYSNSGNLIIPLVSYMLGPEWVVYTVAFLGVQIVIIWTHGFALFSGERKPQLRKILLNPNILAVGLGLLLMLSGLKLPAFVTEITAAFADMLGPMAMLIAGLLAAHAPYQKVARDKRLYLAVAVRTLVCPVVVLAAMKLFALFVTLPNMENILLISYLAAIPPSASTVVQFATLTDVDPDLAAVINIVSTVVCVGTMPLFVALYQAII
jgi:predicted permease